MSDESATELILELARDLEPVRPLPRLRSVVAGLVGVWLAVAIVGISLKGLRSDLPEMLLAPLGPGGVFAGLAVAGLGGLVAALAMSVPGRERAARAGIVSALAGMAAAAGVGTLLFVQSPIVEMHASAATDLTCLAIACAVAFVPALGVVWFVGRAAPFRPLVLVLAAAAGTAALGAVAAQASCPYSDVRHLMVGHLLAPGVGALLLSLPLLVALRRSSRS